MKNKDYIFIPLLFCIFFLPALLAADASPADDNIPGIATHECTVSGNDNFGFSYACEPFQSPTAILFDERKPGEKYSEKSSCKSFRVRVLYISEPWTHPTIQSSSLHDLYITHNLSLSQLQTFII